MKKILMLIAAIAMAAVSCEEITTDKGSNTDNGKPSGKLTASFVQTKVTYAETAEMNLQPAWEVGDEIIGFDDSGATYTLKVASVSAETATLSGTVPDGALHLIYKSGAKASDISDKTLAIDYTAQKGDKTMPAVMLADGTVADGVCHFNFANAGAVIGISAVKGVPSGETISKITVEGENLSAASVALSGSALALTAKEKTSDAISTATLSGITTTDANGTLNKPIFIAVPANATIAKVSAFVAKEPETMKKPSATPQEGVDYVTIAGLKWAKWNVGANTEKDYGWYFPWAGTEGYFRYADTWQSVNTTSIEFFYSLSSAKTVNASDYLYVKEQIFNITGYSFDWAHAPFNNGSSSYDETYFNSVKNTVYLDNSLALDYDAARANWGGNWRMPTTDEIKMLYNTCFNGTYDRTTYESTDCGESTSFSKGIYWCSNYDGVPGCLFCDGTSKLFFPAGGFGKDSDIDGFIVEDGIFIDGDVYIYSGSLKNDSVTYGLNCGFSGIARGYTCGRFYGQNVRPVLD